MSLSDLRKSKNLTLKQVGVGLGFAPNSVWQYEQGIRSLTFGMAKKFADFYGITLDDFWGYYDGK